MSDPFRGSVGPQCHPARRPTGRRGASAGVGRRHGSRRLGRRRSAARHHPFWVPERVWTPIVARGPCHQGWAAVPLGAGCVDGRDRCELGSPHADSGRLGCHRRCDPGPRRHVGARGDPHPHADRADRVHVTDPSPTEPDPSTTTAEPTPTTTEPTRRAPRPRRTPPPHHHPHRAHHGVPDATGADLDTPRPLPAPDEEPRTTSSR